MLLAFETSCDETSVAVVHRGRVLSNLISSQVQIHSEYGGVVPELAAREHLLKLSPLTRAALNEANVDPDGLEAVAATRGPGLPGALIVGLKAAQAVAFALRRPLFGIHHHEAHLYSPWIQGQPPAADFAAFEPHVSLIVSGGHTMLVLVEDELKHRVLGSTLDDAAGECFDKTGKMLGLPYPAGPVIDRLAETGDPDAFSFPQPMIQEPHDDFSFSGLKTSVRYYLRDHPELPGDPSALRDLCASIQKAIVGVLVAKSIRACRRLRLRCVTASGGVTCNRALRAQLASACAAESIRLRLASGSLCTDNAAMIGILAERKLARGVEPTPLDAEILPGWELRRPNSSATIRSAPAARASGTFRVF
jgi:N6-L-threonylcarbamoyladenine synthase